MSVAPEPKLVCARGVRIIFRLLVLILVAWHTQAGFLTRLFGVVCVLSAFALVL